jgi:hypothetical protein
MDDVLARWGVQTVADLLRVLTRRQTQELLGLSEKHGSAWTRSATLRPRPNYRKGASDIA